MKCLNCGAECTDAYCPKCGQKTSVKRFQLKEIVTNTIHSLLGSDNKLWHTCVCLLTRPGHMIREYLLGKRVCYYAPVPLLVCLVAIYAIATYFFTDVLSPFDVVKLDLKDDGVNSDSTEVFLSYYSMLLSNKVYFAIYSVVISILPYRIIFHKSKLARPAGTSEPLNLAEHFVALTFQTCFNMILAFLLIPFSTLEETKNWVSWICIVFPTLYCFILYKQLLGITWKKSILLNLVAVIASIIQNVVILLLIFGFLYGIDNVE